MIAVVMLARVWRHRIRLTGSLRHYYLAAPPAPADCRLANYLVTGGAGFIGSHLSEALVTRGHRVRVVDSFVTGFKRNIRDGVEFVEGDLADAAVAAGAVKGMDYVLHQAAIPSVPRSVDKPAESHRANVDATLNLLMA